MLGLLHRTVKIGTNLFATLVFILGLSAIYITLTYGISINQISPKYRQKSCQMRLFIITFRAYPRIMVKCKTTNGREITNIATHEQMKQTPNGEKICRRWRQDVKIASF